MEPPSIPGWFTARSRAVIGNRNLTTVIAGLVVLVAAFVETSVVAGVAFTPSEPLTELRIGAALSDALISVGAALLGLAAWRRASELAIPPMPPPDPSKPSAPSYLDSGVHQVIAYRA